MPKVTESYLNARRSEIVDAAEACFLRKGVHQSTMQDICEQAELSPGAVYRYFSSKNELMKAVIERNTERWADVMEHAKQRSPEPGEVLWMIGQYFFQRFNEPDFAQRVAMDIESRPEILRDPVLLASSRAQLRTIRDLLTGLVRDQYPADSGIDPEALVNLFMAMYIGLELHKVIDPEHVDVEAVMTTFDQVFGLAEEALARRQASGAGPFQGKHAVQTEEGP